MPVMSMADEDDALANALVERALRALRRNCAASHGALAIVVDPVLADPLVREPTFEEALASGRIHRQALPPIHADIDPDKAPYLLHVPDEPAAERLVNLSVRMAIKESLGLLSDTYLGRSICAWFCSNDAPAIMAKRLATIARVVNDRGQVWPLRLWDPRVFWHLPRVLQDLQWQVVQTELAGWCTLSPTNELVALQPNAGALPAMGALPLRFDSISWQTLERIATINKTLAIGQAWDLMPTPAQAQRIDALLLRCQAMGFEREQDGCVFAATALTCHERFDEHPRVREALRRAEAEDHALSTALDDFDDAFWAELATGAWLRDTNSTSSTPASP